MGPTTHASYKRSLPKQKLLGKKSMTVQFGEVTNSLCLSGMPVWRLLLLSSWAIRPHERRFSHYTKRSIS